MAARVAYKLDFVTAWYAASLASNKVILGVGVDHLRTNWYVILLFLVFIPLVFLPLYRQYADELAKPAGEALQLERAEPLSQPRQEANSRSRTNMAPWAVVAVVSAVLVVLIGFVGHQWGILLAITVMIPVGIGANLLTGYGALRKGPPLRIAAEIALLLYIASVLASFLTGSSRALPLPPIEIPQESGSVLRGRLLNHADGYWHVLSNEQGGLVSIKDDNAKAVTIAPRTSATPSATRAATP